MCRAGWGRRQAGSPRRAGSGALGLGTGLGAKEPGAEMVCSHSRAGRGSLVRDRPLGDLAPSGHWALFPFFMDGETEAQGKELVTPGSPSFLPSAVPHPQWLLCPLTTRVQLWSAEAEGLENQVGTFLERCMARPPECRAEIHPAGGPFDRHASTQGRREALLTGREQRHGNIPSAPSGVFQGAQELHGGVRSGVQLLPPFRCRPPSSLGLQDPYSSQKGSSELCCLGGGV